MDKEIMCKISERLTLNISTKRQDRYRLNYKGKSSWIYISEEEALDLVKAFEQDLED